MPRNTNKIKSTVAKVVKKRKDKNSVTEQQETTVANVNNGRSRSRSRQSRRRAASSSQESTESRHKRKKNKSGQRKESELNRDNELPNSQFRFIEDDQIVEMQVDEAEERETFPEGQMEVDPNDSDSEIHLRTDGDTTLTSMMKKVCCILVKMNLKMLNMTF